MDYKKLFERQRNKEALAAYNLEKKLLKSKKRAVYIPLEHEDINWYWDHNEVCRFDELWKTGVSLLDMAEQLNRAPVEIMLMIMDRDLEGHIKPRKGGIWGV
jgi:hypothetical protein